MSKKKELGHLERAVHRLLSRQATAEFPALMPGHYIVDLIDDVLNDPRIAESNLDLREYQALIGTTEWAALLEKHRHRERSES